MKPRTELKQEEIDKIIDSCEVCYLGMADGSGRPYVLPFNFGYSDGVLYLHGGPGGKKFDILNENEKVCISFSTDHQLKARHEQVACSHFMKYRSVLLHGRAEMISDYDEKIDVLNIMMKKYTGRSDFKYNAPAINNVQVFKIVVEKAEGRTYGYE